MTATSLEVMFDALAGASIAGAVVALGVWALSAAIGRLPAAVRCTLWWLVVAETAGRPDLDRAGGRADSSACDGSDVGSQRAGGGDARRDAIRRGPGRQDAHLARGADGHLAGRAGGRRGVGHWPVAPHLVDSRTRARGRCRTGEPGARVV